MANLALVLLIANTLSSVIVLLRQFALRGGYVSLPFLTALMFLIWYLPQAWILFGQEAVLPESLARLFFMSLLCFWALVFGWRRGLRRKLRFAKPLELPVKRLLVPVSVITLFAIAMHALINLQPAEVRAMSQWSGPITILYFFSSVSVVSMALSTAMIMKRLRALTVLLFALNLSIYLPLIAIYFRRVEIFEFVLALLLGVLFVRRKAVPRTIIFAGALAGMFIVNGIGQLRALSGGYQITAAGEIEARLPALSEIAEIDWFATIDQSDAVYRLEAYNAAVGMEAITLYGSFTLGAQYWNKMVFAYVPGQIVGHQFKQSLFIGSSASSLASLTLGFEKHTGSTSTGFLDTYHDFWFLGCVIWWLIGFISGSFMRHALQGSLVGYILYAATIANSILSISHYGYYFFVNSLLSIFAVLFLMQWLRRASGLSIRRSQARDVVWN
jgi:hypothetical protein